MNSFSFCLLVSGSLGLHCLIYIYRKRKVVCVLTDKKSYEIIEFCKQNEIPIFIGNPRYRGAKIFFQNLSADVLLSINYLFIIEKDIIEFPSKYAINFHGSLLPKYRGRSPHIWAIINNENKTGITAHIMTEGCDEGDIIYQEILPINSTDTGADILNLYSLKYPSVIDIVIDILENDEVTFIKQDSTKATWFGKRVPEDGEIKWYWQKERIYNWVRAQAKPYPGAFTFYKNEKIIINRLEFCDYGFSQNDANGKILLGGIQPIIKTPNGAVRLTDIEKNKSIIFQKDEILHERY